MLVGALLGSRAALHAEGPCCAAPRRHPLAGSCSPGGGWRGYCLMPPPRPPPLPRADTRNELPAHPSVQELRSFPPRATSWDPWASWISCRASEQQHRTAQRSRRPRASARGLTAPRRGTPRLERKARRGDTSRKPPRQSLALCMHLLQVPRGHVQHDLQRECRATVLSYLCWLVSVPGGGCQFAAPLLVSARAGPGPLSAVHWHATGLCEASQQLGAPLPGRLKSQMPPSPVAAEWRCTRPAPARHPPLTPCCAPLPAVHCSLLSWWCASWNVTRCGRQPALGVPVGRWRGGVGRGGVRGVNSVLPSAALHSSCSAPRSPWPGSCSKPCPMHCPAAPAPYKSQHPPTALVHPSTLHPSTTRAHPHKHTHTHARTHDATTTTTSGVLQHAHTPAAPARWWSCNGSAQRSWRSSMSPCCARCATLRRLSSCVTSPPRTAGAFSTPTLPGRS